MLPKCAAENLIKSQGNFKKWWQYNQKENWYVFATRLIALIALIHKTFI